MPGTLLRAVIVEEFVIIVFPKRVFFLLAFLLFNIFDNTHRHSKFKSICFSITIKIKERPIKDSHFNSFQAAALVVSIFCCICSA